jgi:hypothetical protein
MLFLWSVLAVWLIAALTLPLYMLIAALFRNRNHRRAANKIERARLMRVAALCHKQTYAGATAPRFVSQPPGPSLMT